MAGGSFDISGLERLQRQLNAVDVDAIYRECAAYLAQVLIRKVRQRTPVDTGTLRRSWEATEVEKQGDMYVVTVTNPLEYAPYVEHGHATRAGKNGRKWVEGARMLYISEEELKDAAPGILERRLERKLREAFANGNG